MGTVVVKVGGSVLTDKNREGTFFRERMVKLAWEMRNAHDGLVLVHGAGSFGHPLAKRAGLKNGIKDSKQVNAASKVSGDVRRLNSMVCSAMESAGLAPMQVSTSSVVRNSNGALSQLNIQPYKDFLSSGFTPVSFGDVVPDDRLGVSICSGDPLACEIAQDIGASRIIFAVDVDGIYSKPPDQKGATLQRRLTSSGLADITAGDSAGIDVTGGMGGKVKEIQSAVSAGMEVVVLNGNKSGLLELALAGKEFMGTIITDK